MISGKIPTQLHLENLRKVVLQQGKRLHPDATGNLEDDLARCKEPWIKMGGFLQNEDGVKIDYDDILWVRDRTVSLGEYAHITLGNERYRLHSLICPTFGAGFTDHINQDKLDNRKKNLRVATISQSNINRPYKRKKTSQYRGVSRWNLNNGKYQYGYWRATICLNRKTVTLGVRETELEAAILYNEHAKRIHGEFAQLNIIP